MDRKFKIIVAGYIVGGPLGGMVWHHLQYLLGLKDLGHEILFIEDSDDYESCYNPQTNTISIDPSYGLSFITKVLSDYDIGKHWAYYSEHKNKWFGKSYEEVTQFAKTSDIFLNLSGIHPTREIFEKIPVRVFVDTDPAFTQISNIQEPLKLKRALWHTHFFSFGENVGRTGCTIPSDGFAWKATRQPVHLASWDVLPGPFEGNWTTVMQWDSYKVKEYNGMSFGMKSASFKDYLNLPSQTTEKLELAIGSPSTPKVQLEQAGWKLTNPLLVTLDHKTYQKFIEKSKGEWSVAKHGYVLTHSGWFSERSACYLASGRPVIVQDSGFSNFLPTGHGIHAFSTLDEAVEAFEKVNLDYRNECKQARNIIKEFFDSRKVLQELLNQL